MLIQLIWNLDITKLQSVNLLNNEVMSKVHLNKNLHILRFRCLD